MAEPRHPILAIVGSASLLGREVHDVVRRQGLPATVKPIGAEDEDGAQENAEPVVMTTRDEEYLRQARVVVLAGSAASSRRAQEILDRVGARAALIDLTRYWEASPRARLRAPMVEPAGRQLAADVIHVIAHPAAIALALFFVQVQRRYPIRRSVVHIFEPASERGRPGVEELKEQTVGLLTFKAMPKRVFDEQLGFNLLARYGSQAPEALEQFELRLERHLASLLAEHGCLPMPSLRLLQVPVFHGHSFSIWAEFEENPGAEALERALATEQIDVRGAGAEAPTAVGFAGQSGVAVGAIAADRNNSKAVWFWMVSDNLRLAAENAAAVAATLLAEGGAS